MATKTKTKAEAKVEPLSAKEAATELGTDARTLRKFLRKKNGLVGQGNRWAIDPSDIDELRQEFEAYVSSPKAEKKSPPVDEADDEAMELDLEEIDDEELEELG